MTKSAKFREALKALQNPYASLQLEGEPAERSPREQWRVSENPYAQEFYLGATPDSRPRDMAIHPAADSLSCSPRGLSRSDFDKQARAIFRSYIPAEERAKLRPHHRAFIDRNKGRSPRARAALIAALRRYDLLPHRGLSPQFNREEGSFTEGKLRAIEAQVDVAGE
jgi:hypothetical protein